MNPDTNKFEKLLEAVEAGNTHEGRIKEIQELLDTHKAVEKRIVEFQKSNKLLRPDGTPVPDHWSIFSVDELVTIKNYTFKIAHIGESHLLLEPYGPFEVGVEDE